MRALDDALPEGKRLGWFEQADEALTGSLAGQLGAGDVLLVKGSNRVFWAQGYVRSLQDSLESSKKHP